MLAATSEDKPQGPPVNGRKGKLAECSVFAVVFVCSCAA